MSTKEFVGSGTLLYIDSIILAATNWVFWLLISQFTIPSQVGQGTFIVSFSMLVVSIIQLGLEYPLVKKTSQHASKTFGTALILSLIITIVSIPIALFAFDYSYDKEIEHIHLFMIGLILLSPLFMVSRFSLLGVTNVKDVFIIDMIGSGIKFSVGVGLAMADFGTTAILAAFLLQILFTAISLTVLCFRKLKFQIGERKYFKEVLLEGIVNSPSKLSRTVIFSSSVVLLGSFGIGDSSIGIFYITLMVSVMVSGFANNVAFMVIPTSSKLKRDLSLSSARIGLSITAPLVTTLLVANQEILGLIGSEYATGDNSLSILAISILPFIIVMNTISKLNNLNKNKKIVILGSAQMIIFVASFFFLVPQLETLGASFSILIAFVITSIICLLWSKELIRYFANSLVSVGLGWAGGYLISTMLPLTPIILVSIVSVAVTILVVLVTKNTSPSEIKYLIKSMLKTKDANQ